MNVSINFSADIETNLRRRAAAVGKDVEMEERGQAPSTEPVPFLPPVARPSDRVPASPSDLPSRSGERIR